MVALVEQAAGPVPPGSKESMGMTGGPVFPLEGTPRQPKTSH